MTNHRTHLFHASLALLPLTACLQPMSSGDEASGTSTGMVVERDGVGDPLTYNLTTP